MKQLRAIVCGQLAFWALLPALGCGKAAAPPEGAPTSASQPTVDMGAPSGAQQETQSPSTSAPELGTPQGDPGEKKS